MEDNTSQQDIVRQEDNIPRMSAPEQPKTQSLRYAAFSERFLAYAIDAVPFLFFTYGTVFMMGRNGMLFSPLWVASVCKCGWVSQMTPFALTELICKLVWMVVYVAYVTVLSAGGRATLGKLILGIRVRAADGVSPLPLWRSFVRTIGYFASNAVLFLGYLSIFVSPEKKALHDCLAASRVVRVREKTEFANGFIFSAAWGVFGLLAASFLYGSFLKPTPDDIRRVNAARRELGTLAYLEEVHRHRYGQYTDDMSRIAALSGNTQTFQQRLLDVFLSDQGDFVVAIRPDGYRFSVKAKDRRKTRLVREGP
ncbi:MAG: RDD family protein [Elusimicrobiales bacterium]